MSDIIDIILIGISNLYESMNICLSSKSLAKITIHSTIRCNLDCWLCPFAKIKREGISEPDVASGQDFTFSLFKKLVDELRAYDNFREIHINFSGGEPFLNPEIFEIIRYGRENGIRLMVYTNGTLPTESWQPRLFDFPPRFLMFSIDGLKAEHDQVRGAGNFDKTIGAIKKIQMKKKNFGFRQPFIASNTVINKLNVNSFDGVLGLGEALGIDIFYFSFVQWSNEKMIKMVKDEFALRLGWQDSWSKLIEGTENPYGNFSDKEIETLIKKIKEIKNSHLGSEKIYFYPDFSSEKEIRNWFSDTCGRINICDHASNRIRINYNGDVFPSCSMIFFPFGNIKHQELKEIMEGEKATRFFSEIEKNGYFYACQRCCRRSAESRII